MVDSWRQVNCRMGCHPDVTICGDWSFSSLNSLFITLVADFVQLFQLFFNFAYVLVLFLVDML
jgi:hypothetical protein